jgi:D-alanine transaminase
MSRIAYVNGSFIPLEEAKISIQDRGFLFADGVYEVTAVIQSGLVDVEPHLARLERSLREIELQMPVSREELIDIHLDLVDKNALSEGGIYMQITRGVAERDFAFPKRSKPSLVLFTQSRKLLGNPLAETGSKIVSVEDLRWKRRDIKSIALLAQVIAKQEAVSQGANEAWMVEDGYVTEGSSSTSFIITQNDVLVTRPLGHSILPGITRKAVMALAKDHNLEIDERPFTLEEAYQAKEAFLTSASTFVMPVVSIDGKLIGDGKPGEKTMALRKIYIETALKELVKR